MLISCPDDEKRPKLSNTPSPTPTPTDGSDASSKEIERLKSKIDELTNNPTGPTEEEDGWLLVGEPKIGEGVSIRVDFDDDDFDKRMSLTISECGNVRLLKSNITSDSVAFTDNIDSEVGEYNRVSFYRPNGEVNAPSGACKLTASLLDTSGKQRESKSKEITIKAGVIKLSKAKNPDGTFKPFFATKSGRVTLDVAIKGIGDNEVSITLWKETSDDDYRHIGEARGDTGSDGELIGAEICKGSFIAEENEEVRCVGDWLTRIPTEGSHMGFNLGCVPKKGVATDNQTGIIDRYSSQVL